MGLYDPFGHLKHMLWSKERSGVKLAIWLPTIKSQESTRFSCAQMACITSLESSRRGLQLFFKPHINRRSACKVMGPQNCKSANFENFGTPKYSHLGISRQNAILMWASGRDIEYNIWGGRWWLPPSSGRGESCESECAHGLS
jgi:hypothetical protein